MPSQSVPAEETTGGPALKKLSEMAAPPAGGPAAYTPGTRNCIPVHADTITVQREHIDFLRRMVTGGNQQLLELLNNERSRNGVLQKELDQLRGQVTGLKLALAQAIREIDYHNRRDDIMYTTGSDDLTEWGKLLQGNC